MNAILSATTDISRLTDVSPEQAQEIVNNAKAKIFMRGELFPAPTQAWQAALASRPDIQASKSCLQAMAQEWSTRLDDLSADAPIAHQAKMLCREIALFGQLAELLDILWQCTVTLPGEAAGMVRETTPAQDVERLQARTQTILAIGHDLVQRSMRVHMLLLRMLPSTPSAQAH